MDIKPEVLENIQTRCVNAALDEKPTMGEMVRAIFKGLKDGKATGGDGIRAEVSPTDCTDGSSKYGRKVMYHKSGRMPT